MASSAPDLMDGCKLVELEKKLKKEQGTVTRERLEELLGEAIDPGKVAIVVDLVFSALDLPEDGGIEVESLAHLVETKNNSGEMLRQRLCWLFRMYDTDASGTISLGEMVEIFSGLYLSEVIYKHTILSSPRAKRAESARAVTGRQCHHSGVGEDFLVRRQVFFRETTENNESHFLLCYFLSRVRFD